MATSGGKLSPDGRSVTFRLSSCVLDMRVWCDDCLTSAAVTFGVFTESGSQVGTVTRCLRCNPVGGVDDRP